MSSGSDAVIVGGGVIGLSSAWEAATRGLSVSVVDPAPGRGASWVAAGMLAPVTETSFGEGPLVALLVEAAARWPAFAERLADAGGTDPGFQASGTVVVAVDASDRAAVDHMLAYQQQLGLEARRLSASDCRSLVPVLAPGVRGGAVVPGDHHVDNRRLVGALLAACEKAGVRMVAERATAVAMDGGRAVGVRLARGEVQGAGTVVVAAGADSGGLGGVPDGVLPPVRPVKGHVVRLRGPADAPLLEHTVRGLVHGRPCYLVPRRDGSLVVGATTEERGFDRTVQAGAVHSLLDDARTLVPGVDELELVECLAGLRPGSPDNRPWVGATAVPGLAVATGHYRNGILLTPLTAHAVATFLECGAVPPPLDGFPPGRLVEPGVPSR
jgi:glycine oxidase